MKSPNLSERVCNPCARKIRNLFKLFAEIKNAISQDEAKVEQVNVSRSKRQLATSVSTPDRSPCNRKVLRAQAKVPSSQKSLFSSEGALNLFPVHISTVCDSSTPVNSSCL